MQFATSFCGAVLDLGKMSRDVYIIIVSHFLLSSVVLEYKMSLREFGLLYGKHKIPTLHFYGVFTVEYEREG